MSLLDKKLKNSEKIDIAVRLIKNVLDEPELALKIKSGARNYKQLQFDYDCLNTEYDLILKRYEALQDKYEQLTYQLMPPKQVEVE